MRSMDDLMEAVRAGARATADYAKRMRAIGLNGCPPDFKVAFLAHIHAWESKAEVLQEAVDVTERNNRDNDEILAAFRRGMRFDSQALWDRAVAFDAAGQVLQEKLKKADSEVENSWRRVELIAAKYDAKLPNGQ
jgi:hypothetical protein